jgi:hypothetical protein
VGATTNRALNLLFSQFESSVNLIEWYKAYLNRAEEIDAILIDLATRRWLDTAEGVWLDDIGDIVGIPRFFVEEDPGNIFTFADSAGQTSTTQGFGDGDGTGGVWQDMNGTFTSVLIDDDTYRIWIKTKILITDMVGTPDDIYLFIKEAFDDTTSVVTTSDPAGKILVELDTPLTIAERAQLVRYAPRIAGFSIEITN